MREFLMELYLKYGERDFPQSLLLGVDHFYTYVAAERAGYVRNHVNGYVCISPKGLEYLKQNGN